VEVVKDAMRRIKEAAGEVNKQSEEIRERLYYLIYNSTILIFRACN
jgi:ribosomal protein L12E/L44/L45/RPP1/RPP2